MRSKDCLRIKIPSPWSIRVGEGSVVGVAGGVAPEKVDRDQRELNASGLGSGV